MQKLLVTIAIIAVASTGVIGYGLGNSGSTIPPARPEQVYVAPVSKSDSSDRFAQSRAQLQHAKRPATEARNAADEVAVAARWQWFENGCVEDLIRITAADDSSDSAEDSLSKREKILLSELK